MKNEENIEKLFKETFDRFEADVNPQVWTNVQSGISSAAGGATSAAAKFALGKIIAGVASVAVITGSVWYFASSNNNSSSVPAKQDQEQTQAAASTEETPQQNAAAQDQSGNNGQVKNNNTDSNTGSVMPPAVRSLNHYSSDNSQQMQNASSASRNENPTDASASENTGSASAQSEQHKYGKAPVGTGSMMRNPQEENQKTKSSRKKNTSDQNQDAEEAPAVSISASSESGDWPLTVNFSNQGLSTALSWDFDDGTFSREASVSHTFNKPGNYVVRLVAQNSKGSNTDKVTIEVKPVSGFEIIPNVFTPNGDGLFDEFKIETKKMASIEVVISDLNGRIVGGWNTVEGNWNGKLKNGEDAAEGQYFYTYHAVGIDGVNYPPKNGTVTLSRKR
jgi:gliding motility-associated-like protein